MNKKINLFIIDMQNDFCSINGNLYVKGAMKDIENICNDFSDIKFQCMILSQDKHKKDAPWFEGSPGNFSGHRWKPHCIENTWGYELNSKIKNLIKEEIPYNCIDKGYGTFQEEYSLFSTKDFYKYDNSLYTPIFNADEFIFVGEALDYCVYNSVKDFIKFSKERGFDNTDKIFVSTRYSSSISEDFEAIENMYKELGVKLRNSGYVFNIELTENIENIIQFNDLNIIEAQITILLSSIYSNLIIKNNRRFKLYVNKELFEKFKSHRFVNIISDDELILFDNLVCCMRFNEDDPCISVHDREDEKLLLNVYKDKIKI